MNNEQQELLDEAYKAYENKYYKGEAFGYKKLNDLEYSPDLKLSQEEFINKCKTDTEFSERWGLKIEERELSDEESIFHYEKELYSPLRIIDQKIPVIPTKLITITYKDKTIESYG